ncbi:hypothetical protein TrRE_jg8598, partial [Triparma retinervis]
MSNFIGVCAHASDFASARRAVKALAAQEKAAEVAFNLTLSRDFDRRMSEKRKLEAVEVRRVRKEEWMARKAAKAKGEEEEREGRRMQQEYEREQRRHAAEIKEKQRLEKVKERRQRLVNKREEKRRLEEEAIEKKQTAHKEFEEEWEKERTHKKEIGKAKKVKDRVYKNLSKLNEETSLEAEIVRGAYDKDPTIPVVGVTEQNVLLDVLHSTPNTRVSAVSAMFRQSPLHLLSLSQSSSTNPSTVGCHSDTVSLVQRLLPHSTVIAVPRSTKLDLLLSHEIDAVQIYDTTELATLSSLHPSLAPSLISTPLSSYGAKLGYGQVVFAPAEVISSPSLGPRVSDFLDATYEGWRICMSDPERAVGAVKRACEKLKLGDEGHNHYNEDDDFLLAEIIRNVNDKVAETKEGPYLGVIDRDSSSSNSWYSKVETGSKHGVDVESVVLPPTASTADVLGAIDRASSRDGIQLMWPLPPSVDSTLCYSSIPASQDVDGLVPGSPTLPVTAAAALALLASRSVEVKGGDCVVVGRSRIAGKPLAEALGDMGATV